MADGEIDDNIKLIFSDGILNANNSTHVVKFNLVPFVSLANNPSVPRIAAQIAMPIDGFVNSVVFLNRFVKSLVKSGYITQEFVDGLQAKEDKS